MRIRNLQIVFWVLATIGVFKTSPAAEPAPIVPETVSKGAELTEVYADNRVFDAPSWNMKTKKLYFSASSEKNQQMLQMDTAGKVTVWMDNTEGVNGTYITLGGYIWMAQSSANRIVVANIGPEGPLNIDVRYEDPNLNQLGDFLFTWFGRAYFADRDAIYFLKLKGKGTATKVVTDAKQPNGFLVSNDGRFLYVGDSAALHWKSYRLSPDGKASEPRIFFDPKTENKNAPDGMAMDAWGNLYCTGRGGVWVLTKEGKSLGLIAVKERTTHVAFGGEKGMTLYITCENKVYALQMKECGQMFSMARSTFTPDIFDDD